MATQEPSGSGGGAGAEAWQPVSRKPDGSWLSSWVGASLCGYRDCRPFAAWLVSILLKGSWPPAFPGDKVGQGDIVG